MTTSKQIAALKRAEKKLKVGPVAMAELMGVSYDTYKNWRSGRRKMPAVAVRCLTLVVVVYEPE